MEGIPVTQDEVELLVKKAKAGDRAAFDELFQEHGTRLESMVRSRLGEKLRRKVGADDILQDTALRAFQSLDRFTWRQEDSFYRWLCAIAEHLIWNAAQKHPRGELTLNRDVAQSDTTPSKRMRRNERFDRLVDAMRSLKPDEREVVTLSRIEGLKMKEIAERMGRSPAAVKMLLFRGLKQLKKNFGDTESLHLPDRSLDPGEGNHGKR